MNRKLQKENKRENFFCECLVGLREGKKIGDFFLSNDSNPLLFFFFFFWSGPYLPLPFSFFFFFSFFFCDFSFLGMILIS